MNEKSSTNNPNPPDTSSIGETDIDNIHNIEALRKKFLGGRSPSPNAFVIRKKQNCESPTPDSTPAFSKSKENQDYIESLKKCVQKDMPGWELSEKSLALLNEAAKPQDMRSFTVRLGSTQMEKVADFQHGKFSIVQG